MERAEKRRRCRGAAIVELALALPLLLAMLFGIIEFGSVFFVRHNMVQAAREAARTLAVQSGTAGEANAVAVSRLSSIPSINFTITIQEPDPNDPSDRDVMVRITAPLAEAALSDPFGILGQGNVRAEVTMRKEG